MAHPIGTEGFLYKPRYRKIRSHSHSPSYWFTRVTHSSSYWFIQINRSLWSYSSEPFQEFSVSGLVSVTEKWQINCGRSTSFYEASNNRSLCSKDQRFSSLITLEYFNRLQPTSKSPHIYISIYTYIHIYISYLNRGFFFYYIRVPLGFFFYCTRAPLGFYDSINPRIFLFFAFCFNRWLLIILSILPFEFTSSDELVPYSHFLKVHR